MNFWKVLTALLSPQGILELEQSKKLGGRLFDMFVSYTGIRLQTKSMRLRTCGRQR